jgi:hypothetical protein
MFCPNCGAQNDAESAFCSKCGTALLPHTIETKGAAEPTSAVARVATARAPQPSPSAKDAKADAKAAEARAKALRPWYKRKRYYLLAVVLVIIIASIAGSHKPANPGGSSTPTTSPSGGSAPTTVTPTTAAPIAQDVVFICTGDAPGVSITYGSETTNDSGGGTPFHAILALDTSSDYYDVTAQLGGSGSVACSVTVHWDQGGQSYVVRQVGSASGGYNIADPEVCSDFTGGWEAC